VRTVSTAVERRFVAVPSGQIHCAIAGDGDPALLLHQTPRSWLEYRDVIPLLARNRRVIAMDTIGFGDSSRLPAGEDSVERWASVAIELLDALDLDKVDLVGHHTGGYVGTEIAVAYPDRIRAAVLSGLFLHGREGRLEHATGRAVVDDVDRRADGSHVKELWDMRAAFYPPDPDLLERFLVDCLKAGDLAAEGHRIVARYAFEERVPLLRRPTLFLMGDADPYAFPSLDALLAAVPHAESAVIAGGMVPLPDQLPAEFAAAVEAFLARM